MTGASFGTAAAAHAKAVRQVFELLGDNARAIVVNSPPGAGKSTLVRAVAAHVARQGMQVPIIPSVSRSGEARSDLESLC
jgi:putative protein kinase ArgK-like GTPase of G3E family